MTTAEEILFKKAYDISRYWDRKRDLTANEQMVLQQAYKIMLMRFYDIFQTVMDHLIEDPNDRFMFYLSFLRISLAPKKWFLRMEQSPELDRIVSKKVKP